MRVLAAPIAALFLMAAAPAPKNPAAPVVQQQQAVKRLCTAQLRMAYPEALLELARRQERAGQWRPALGSALEASTAFDRLVELHKALSEAVPEPAQVRGARTAAHSAALQRDAANFLAARLAQRLGDTDTAIRRYVMVVQSQGEEPVGQEAYGALVALGFAAPAASPSPAGPVPSPSVRP